MQIGPKPIRGWVLHIRFITKPCIATFLLVFSAELQIIFLCLETILFLTSRLPFLSFLSSPKLSISLFLLYICMFVPLRTSSLHAYCEDQEPYNRPPSLICSLIIRGYPDRPPYWPKLPHSHPPFYSYLLFPSLSSFWSPPSLFHWSHFLYRTQPQRPMVARMLWRELESAIS